MDEAAYIHQSLNLTGSIISRNNSISNNASQISQTTSGCTVVSHVSSPFVGWISIWLLLVILVLSIPFFCNRNLRRTMSSTHAYRREGTGNDDNTANRESSAISIRDRKKEEEMISAHLNDYSIELTDDLIHTLVTACKRLRDQSCLPTIKTKPFTDFDRGDIAEGLLLPKPGIRAQQAFIEKDIDRFDVQPLPINIVLENEQSTSKPDPPMQEVSYSTFRPVECVCAICLDVYTVSDVVTWSSNQCCTHSFHRDCILNWLLIQGKNRPIARARPQAAKDDRSLLCPCCRVPFIELSLYSKSMDNTGSDVVFEGNNRNCVLPAGESAAEETETSFAEMNSQDSLSISSLDP